MLMCGISRVEWYSIPDSIQIVTPDSRFDLKAIGQFAGA